MVIRAACPVATVTSTPLLRLDRLVDALAPLAAFGQPAGILVDDDHFAVADDELPVARVLAIDHDRLLDVAVDVDHADGVQALRLGQRRTFCRPSRVSSAVFFSWSYS